MDLTDPAVINTVRQVEKLGQEQYHTYVNGRLVNQTKPITDPIRRNNLPLFSRSPVREKSRTHLQLSSLNNDYSLFSRLFIASQMCDGDLDACCVTDGQNETGNCNNDIKSRIGMDKKNMLDMVSIWRDRGIN